MIEVMDDDGVVKCKINVNVRNTLITRHRAREVIMVLLELKAAGVLDFSTESLVTDFNVNQRKEGHS